jgi:hypothetical protein
MKTAVLIAMMLQGFLTGSSTTERAAGKTKAQPTITDQKARPRVDKEKQTQPDPKLVALVNDARSAPPEFGADTLLRVVESGKLTDQAWKRELVSAAFQLATQAKQPVKRASISGALVDSRSGYLSRAFRLGLDGLSLKCRAVKAMVSIDKRKAREMFQEIPQPKLEPLTCEESLVYDVADFYDTLRIIAQNTFAAKTMRLDEYTRFIKSHIEAMNSPIQVGPIAKLILALRLSPPQLETLVHTFSLALAQISGDDRSFAQATTSTSIIPEMVRLITLCKQQDLARDELIEAFRDYLTKNLNADRCIINNAEGEQSLSRPSYIDYFNTNLRFANLPSRKEILPITTEEIKPASIRGMAKIYPYWQSPKSKSLLLRFKNLRFASGDRRFNAKEQSEQEWQWQLSQFLNDMVNWHTEDEDSEADYFHQKSVLFHALIEDLPSGDLRRKVLNDYVAFLSNSRIQQDNPIEWFLQAHYLVDRVRTSQASERSEILEVLNHSHSAALYLYAESERVLASIRQTQ